MQHAPPVLRVGASNVMNKGLWWKSLAKNFLRPVQRGPGEQVLLVLPDLAKDGLVLSVHLG